MKTVKETPSFSVKILELLNNVISRFLFKLVSKFMNKERTVQIANLLIKPFGFRIVDRGKKIHMLWTMKVDKREYHFKVKTTQKRIILVPLDWKKKGEDLHYTFPSDSGLKLHRTRKINKKRLPTHLFPTLATPKYVARDMNMLKERKRNIQS